LWLGFAVASVHLPLELFLRQWKRLLSFVALALRPLLLSARSDQLLPLAALALLTVPRLLAPLLRLLLPFRLHRLDSRRNRVSDS
jgi:hypothetical protein